MTEEVEPPIRLKMKVGNLEFEIECRGDQVEETVKKILSTVTEQTNTPISLTERRFSPPRAETCKGLIQSLFAEGNFDSRIDSVNEFPKGAVSWMFEGSDIFRAKEILGKNCCITGNLPASLVMTGSPEDVKAYCRKLIEVCGKGGGYILACGAFPENPKLENLFAIVEAVKEFGVYK